MIKQNFSIHISKRILLLKKKNGIIKKKPDRFHATDNNVRTAERKKFQEKFFQIDFVLNFQRKKSKNT